MLSNVFLCSFDFYDHSGAEALRALDKWAGELVVPLGDYFACRLWPNGSGNSLCQGLLKIKQITASDGIVYPNAVVDLSPPSSSLSTLFFRDIPLPFLVGRRVLKLNVPWNKSSKTTQSDSRPKALPNVLHSDWVWVPCYVCVFCVCVSLIETKSELNPKPNKPESENC